MITTLYLASNALHVFAMYVFITAIFGKSILPKALEISSYAVYYLANALVYIFLDNMLLNLVSNILPLFLIMFQYRKCIFNNIFMTVIITAFGMFLDWMSSCIAADSVLVKSNTIQSIALISIAFAVRYFYKRDDRMFVNSVYIAILIVNSVGTIAIGLLIGPTFNAKNFIIALSLILMNLLNFYLYDKYIANMKIRIMYNSVDAVNRMYKNQLEIMSESNKKIRLIKHDIDNHIIKIKNYLDDKDIIGALKYIDEMSENLVPEKEYVHTGNVDIDCLMNYKLFKAEKMGVEFTKRIILPDELKVEAFDLTVILGNLLDNALNALENADAKFLNIEMNYSKGMIVIIIENTFREKTTPQQNEEEHGYGLIRVQTSLEKYHGTLHSGIVDNRFEAKAILYNINKIK